MYIFNRVLLNHIPDKTCMFSESSWTMERSYFAASLLSHRTSTGMWILIDPSISSVCDPITLRKNSQPLSSLAFVQKWFLKLAVNKQKKEYPVQDACGATIKVWRADLKKNKIKIHRYVIPPPHPGPCPCVFKGRVGGLTQRERERQEPSL
jgi:hypothetical protein